MARAPVTAILNTLNEADQVEECLRSVEWADEIYLLDSFSTDGTVEIAAAKFPRARIEQRRFRGAAAQKNYAIDRAAHDWIFVIDADERVPEALRDEILRALEAPAHHAFSIGRRNFVLGREVHHSGLQRDRVTRLFDRRHARYPNRRVHADLVVDGPVGRLRHKYLHYYIRSLDHMAEKMTRYGIWGAAQLFVEGRRLHRGRAILVHTFARLFRDLFLNGGILDGARGITVVGLHTYYTFWKYSKLWEFTMLESTGRPVPLPEIETDEEIWAAPWEDLPPPAAGN